MTARPREVVPPEGSLIARGLHGASFCDAWAVRAGEPALSALGQFLKAVRSTPGWVSACMSLRNQLVSRLGLKDLGALSALAHGQAEGEYRPGDRVGIFTLFENTPDEMLLGDRDRHLDVTLSVHRAPDAEPGQILVTITTVVQVHNIWGRIYMIPVTPMHRLIAPSVLRAVAAPAGGARDSKP